MSACGDAPVPSVAPPPERPSAPVGLRLLGADLPAHSRPHAPDVPERLALVGFESGDGGSRRPDPVRSPPFGADPYDVETEHGVRVPRALTEDGDLVGWRRRSGSLEVLLARPQDGEYRLHAPAAAARERRLNFGSSGINDPLTFVNYLAWVAGERRRGLLLPAPARLRATVAPPANARLVTAVRVLEPELADGPPSDGARVVVSVNGAPLWTGAASLNAWTPIEVALPPGGPVSVVIETQPGPEAAFDYVFFDAPVVIPAAATAPGRLIVFTEGLGPDEVGPSAQETTTVSLNPGFAARAALTGRRPDAAATADLGGPVGLFTSTVSLAEALAGADGPVADADRIAIGPDIAGALAAWRSQNPSAVAIAHVRDRDTLARVLEGPGPVTVVGIVGSPATPARVPWLARPDAGPAPSSNLGAATGRAAVPGPAITAWDPTHPGTWTLHGSTAAVLVSGKPSDGADWATVAATIGATVTPTIALEAPGSDAVTVLRSPGGFSAAWGRGAAAERVGDELVLRWLDADGRVFLASSGSPVTGATCVHGGAPRPLAPVVGLGVSEFPELPPIEVADQAPAVRCREAMARR